ncbi:short-chain dehydrogenase/reductase [Lentinula raphanica]|nr:short-chain dehydrogenase/reductase [Lentinula raphanica]
MSFNSLTITKTYHRDTYAAISPTKPSLSQVGKTVLITGGGSGIGFEIARSFAKARASRIIIVGRRAAVVDSAATKLRDEFNDSATEFIPRQGDIGDDSSVAALWDYLKSQNILVDVLILNAAYLFPMAPDTLHMDKAEVMKAFDVNVGGNLLMSSKFVDQSLRPKCHQLHLVNVSTGAIHMNPAPTQNPYATSKAAFAALLGRIADEHPVEDVQILSFHPGVLYSESASLYFDKNLFKWDEMALPADYAVWAASPEASWLHGRFVWAHWDVEELKSDKKFMDRLTTESGFLKVAVQGLTEVDLAAFMNQ